MAYLILDINWIYRTTATVGNCFPIHLTSIYDISSLHSFLLKHTDHLDNDDHLHAGEKIHSPNRALELVMQGDGNLVQSPLSYSNAIFLTFSNTN